MPTLEPIRRRGTRLARRFGLLAVAAAALTQCTEGRLPTATSLLRPAPVRLSISATVGSSGRAMKVVASYARSAAPTVLLTLDSATVPLNTGDSQLPFPLDIAACLADNARELPSGETVASAPTVCILHLVVTLLDAQQKIVDQISLAPLAAKPGEQAVAPPVALGVQVGSITISPRSVTINAIGFGADIIVTAVDRDGAPIGRPALVFTSLAPTVATVDSLTGRAAGKAVGIARIVATSRDKSDTATVTVRQIAKTIALTTPAAVLFPGDSATVAVQARDSADVAIPAAASGVQLRSSDTTVIVVSAMTGVLQAKGPGSATITGSSGTAATTGIVTVKPFVVAQFCGTYPPVFVASQFGAGGVWSSTSASAPGRFNLRIADVGAVAYVSGYRRDAAGVPAEYATAILYGNATELQSYFRFDVCPPAVAPPAPVTFRGSVAGRTASQRARVQFAFSTRYLGFGIDTFTMAKAPGGVHDLFAMTDSTFSLSANDRIILRRGLTPVNGSTLPVLDFASTEAFAPATALLTVAGAGSDTASVFSSLFTANNSYSYFTSERVNASSQAVYASLPNSQLIPGDVRQLTAYASRDSTMYRDISVLYSAVTDRTLTIGPNVATPSLSVVSVSPVVRFRLDIPVQSEYPGGAEAYYGQSNSTGQVIRYVFLDVLPSYAGGVPATWSTTMPDFSQLPGYDVSWGLAAGVLTEWSASVFSLSPYIRQAIDGPPFAYAGRNGSTTPTVVGSAILRAPSLNSATKAVALPDAGAALPVFGRERIRMGILRRRTVAESPQL